MATTRLKWGLVSSVERGTHLQINEALQLLHYIWMWYVVNDMTFINSLCRLTTLDNCEEQAKGKSMAKCEGFRYQSSELVKEPLHLSHFHFNKYHELTEHSRMKRPRARGSGEEKALRFCLLRL